jgi:hypothetical protein
VRLKSPSTAATPPDELKIIRLTSEGINEPDAPYESTYPYKLTAHLSPPDFMQVTFIMLHGGSEELIIRGRTSEALDRFITRNNLKQNPRLRGMMITGPNGDVEEFRR